MKLRWPKKGFTLIELLIVVAIIAILAAIAVPNFLEAQTRSKVSRCKADMRSTAIALETFALDHGFYPPDGFWGSDWILGTPMETMLDNRFTKEWGLTTAPVADSNGHPNFWTMLDCFFLTTPVAYVTSLPKDPFAEKAWSQGSILWQNYQDRNKAHEIVDHSSAVETVDAATGGANDIDGKKTPLWVQSGFGPDQVQNAYTSDDGKPSFFISYDPSNGTVSYGDIYKAGP